MYCYFYPPEESFLDSFSKFANIIIAFLALVFTIYIFYKNSQKENKKEDRTRKNDSLKTIILEHNLKYFFDFYEEISAITDPLIKSQLTDDARSILNDRMVDSLKKFRLGFADLLLAVDKTLYEEIMKNADNLIDSITESMFNPGINLSYKPKFEEEILSKISESKTENVRILYEYNS